MDPQDFATSNSRPRRPRPWRWVLFLAISLLFATWAALDLLPRLAGGLLGRGLELPGGGPGMDWDAVEVVWDPTVAAPTPGQELEAPAPPTAAEQPLESVEDAPDEVATAAPAAGSPGGGEAAPAGQTGPAVDPALAQSGEGDPAGEGRRSPRILYSDWPRREILLALETEGRLRYRLRVEADGRVSSWELLDAGNFNCPPCRGEAERIIAGLRFAPGTLNGETVACWVPYEISFERN